MKIEIFKIINVLFIIIKISLAEGFSTLNIVENGVSCAPVYSSGNGSRVFFHIENLDVEDNVKLEEIKIPFAFFRYTDIAFYDNFPDPEYYNKTYQLSMESRQNIYDGLVDFKTNNIITKRRYVSVKGILDDPNVQTGYLEYKKDKGQQFQREFEIPKSGIYCVLIAPPLDKGIKNLSIPVDFVTSLGLPFEDYQAYYSMKLSVIIGVLLSICLCLALNLSAKEYGISVWVVYYGLVPLVFLQVIELSFLVIENNTNINSNTSRTYDFIEFFAALILLCFRTIIFYWFPLIFSMGVGITYLVNETSMNGKLRELSPQLLKKANYLLLLQIIASSTEIIYLKIQDMLRINTDRGLLENIVKTVGIHGFLWLFWLALSIYYYFVTKTSIQKFPAFEEAGVSVKFTKAFRNSFLTMNFGAMAVFFIHVTLAILRNTWITISSYQKLVDKIGFGKSETISHILSEESGLSNIFSFEHTGIPDYIIFLYLFVVWYDYDQAFSSKREKFKGKIDTGKL